MKEVTEDTIVDIGASFDGSWCSRNSARDAVVAAVSEDTGQVLDAVFLTKECTVCTQLANERDAGKLEYLEYLER